MALPDTPLTRGEVYLDAIANDSSEVPTPLTRDEQYLYAIAKGDASGIPSAPLTRTERYLDYIAQNGGGGGGVEVESLSVTENGTYTADQGKAYSPVEVTVPQTTVEALSVTENGTYTAPDGKAYSPVTVAVSGDPALPSEYQEVEYLTNDGNCWCEVNYQPYNTDYCEIAFSLSSEAPTTECGIVGSSIVTSTRWEILTENNAIDTYGTYISKSYGFENSISRDTKYIVGIKFSTDNSPTTFLWGRYKTDNYPFKGKMYLCRHFAQRGQTQFNLVKLIPCYRKADNVPGFYDVINSTFYTNQGTGTFGIGPNV